MIKKFFITWIKIGPIAIPYWVLLVFILFAIPIIFERVNGYGNIPIAAEIVGLSGFVIALLGIIINIKLK